jgi:hypothetical protein
MYDLIVIGALGFAAWQGSQAGVIASAMVGIEMIVAVTAGVLFHELVAGLLIDGMRLAAEPFLSPDFPYQAVAVPVAFALLTWGTFAAMRFRLHSSRTAGLDSEDEHDEHDTIDRVAGGLVGGSSGVMIAGAALLTLSMVPLPATLRPDPQRMFFDLGGLVLRMAGEFEPDRHDGQSLIIHGEPASRSSDPAAKLASEPWVAGPDEGSPDEGARFSDVDENGSFTKDLYFLDLDGDNIRRVGLRDKYIMGVWSGALDAHARERPKQPDATDAEGRAQGGDQQRGDAAGARGKPSGAPPGKPGGNSRGTKSPSEPPVDDF